MNILSKYDYIHIMDLPGKAMYRDSHYTEVS